MVAPTVEETAAMTVEAGAGAAGGGAAAVEAVTRAAGGDVVVAEVGMLVTRLGRRLWL